MISALTTAPPRSPVAGPGGAPLPKGPAGFEALLPATGGAESPLGAADPAAEGAAPGESSPQVPSRAPHAHAAFAPMFLRWSITEEQPALPEEYAATHDGNVSDAERRGDGSIGADPAATTGAEGEHAAVSDAALAAALVSVTAVPPAATDAVTLPSIGGGGGGEALAPSDEAPPAPTEHGSTGVPEHSVPLQQGSPPWAVGRYRDDRVPHGNPNSQQALTSAPQVLEERGDVAVPNAEVDGVATNQTLAGMTNVPSSPVAGTPADANADTAATTGGDKPVTHMPARAASSWAAAAPDVPSSDAAVSRRAANALPFELQSHVPPEAIATAGDTAGSQSGSREQAGFGQESSSDQAAVKTPASTGTAGAFAAAIATAPLTPVASSHPVDAPPSLPRGAEAAENVSRLIQSMRVQLRDGISEATVRLRPEHLGDVSIAVRVQGDIVSAIVSADQTGVRLWLQSQEDTLRNGLAQQGLHLDRFVVQPDEHQSQEQPAPDPRRPRPRRRPDTTGDGGGFEVSV